MSRAGPRSKTQHQAALADCPHLVALARIPMDQARCRQVPLAVCGTDVQLTSEEEHEGVLVNLVLLEGLALWQQQHDDAIGLLVRAQYPWAMSLPRHVIQLPGLHVVDCNAMALLSYLSRLLLRSAR
jgi:hypothetical protein